MTTLHVTNAWHGQSGGIRAFYTAMLETANVLRRPMRLVVPGERDHVHEVGRYGRVYTLRAPRVPFIDRRYRVILPHHFLVSGGRLREILHAERPEVVEVCDKYALPYFAGWIRRHLPRGATRPTLVGLSCERMDHSLAAMGTLGRVAARMARLYVGAVYLPQCDYHLANSEYTAEELRQAQRNGHPRDVHVVPMGIHAAGFGPEHRSAHWRSEWRQRLDLPADGPLVLYAGRLAQEKRLSAAVAAVAHLRASGVPAGLIFVGSGPDEARLRRTAAALLGTAVGFAGHVAHPAALATAYASADVFLHVNPCEPFGIGPLEAMASGVPVVLPRAGGVLTYANDGNAWLSEPGAAAFGETLRDAIAQPDATRRAAATATAQAYDWAQVAPGVFGWYDTLRARGCGKDAARWTPGAARTHLAQA